MDQCLCFRRYAVAHHADCAQSLFLYLPRRAATRTKWLDHRSDSQFFAPDLDASIANNSTSCCRASSLTSAWALGGAARAPGLRSTADGLPALNLAGAAVLAIDATSARPDTTSAAAARTGARSTEGGLSPSTARVSGCAPLPCWPKPMPKPVGPMIARTTPRAASSMTTVLLLVQPMRG